MRIRIRLVSLLAATLAWAPAYAQVYKWVDENGVTNYSGKRPEDVKAAKKVDVVTQRLTVYKPDEGLMRAIAEGARGSDRILADRMDRLERQLQAERLARQYASAAEAGPWRTAYEQCLAQRRVDCSDSGANASYPPVVYGPLRSQPAPFVPVVAVTGVTAGNVVSAIQSAGGAVNATPGVSNGRFGAFRSTGPARAGRGGFSRW